MAVGTLWFPLLTRRVLPQSVPPEAAPNPLIMEPAPSLQMRLSAALLLLLAVLCPSSVHTQKFPEYREVSGRNNNRLNPTYGAALQPYSRGNLSYVDWYTQPSMAIGARNVSNTLAGMNAEKSPRNLTDFVTYWAEFITMGES